MIISLLSMLVVAAPELVVVHADLPTVPGADAIAVEKGRVSAVGKTAELEQLVKKGTRVIDARGRLVFPGLIDSHVHFASGGINMTKVDLSGTQELPELLRRIQAWAAANPKAPWISGRGWSYDIFKKLNPPSPTREMLDKVMPDRPVFVRAYDGHTGWANSKALEICKIDATTVDPAGGRIVRQKDGKTPAGAFLENAMELLFNCMPKPTPLELREAILAAQAHAIRLGLTAVNDFVATPDVLDIYLALEREGLLKLHVFFSPSLEELSLDEAKALRDRIAKSSKLVKFGSLKGFVDGVIESKTAVLLKPYAGTKNEYGTPILDAKRLAELVVPADHEGFTVSLHTIGDRSVRTVLDTYELAAKTNGTTDRRHRIEHIELLDPADAPRFAKLGVIASMQPFHAEMSDHPGEGVWEVNAAGERLQHAFAWNDILAARGRLAFGSDWAVTTLDPLKGLALAMSRATGHGLPEGGWIPGQKIGFDEALTAYTRSAAIGLHAESELGALEVGKAGDLVILNEKVSAEEPLSFYWGSVDTVVIGGRVVSE